MPTTLAKENPVTAAYVSGYLEKLSALLKSLDPKEVEAVGKLLHQARDEGRQVFVLGNGGSAALASHVAVDLGKGCSRGREKRFKVLSLTDNTPWMTALSNDISYDDVFAEQLANYARKGDVLLAISGSGNSKNVLKALELANRMGLETVGISGFKGGKLKPMVKHHVQVSSEHMGLIEDAQLIVCHILVYGFMDVEGCG
ncbi:MAG: SIS domain-containing protein [Planctomycetota bacterium]|nr:SIS domain-containing protein [Planctomycetota bacterium]